MFMPSRLCVPTLRLLATPRLLPSRSGSRGSLFDCHRQLSHFDVTAIGSETKPHRKNNGNKAAAAQLNFGDHKIAFQHKTARELIRGLVVLYACAVDPLVTHSYKLLTLGERLLGQRMLRFFVAPFYNQFVAGDSEEELSIVSNRLADVGIRLMVAPMLETDVGEGHDMQEMYAKNLNKTLNLIDLSRQHCTIGGARPICQTKITAHLAADILARVSTSYQSLRVEERVAAVAAVAKLLVVAGGNGGPPMSSSSATEALRPLVLTDSDALELIHSLSRLFRLGERCCSAGVVLAVDAEYTYTNPAINLLTLAMMAVFNTPTPVIWNTYQGYLKTGCQSLEHDLELVRALGSDVGFGAKLVRGAYLERERALALLEAYPDPVNDTYKDTSIVYDSMVEVMLQEVVKKPDTRAVVIATHNEASIQQAVARIELLDIDPRAGSVVFGQVYGMAENISVPLAASGFLVYKSVPSGSMSEVIPYLSRRANENKAVLRGARRERQLLSKELLSRLSLRR